MARVDGEPITVGQVRARAEQAGVPPLAALESAIDETVFAQRARADGEPAPAASAAERRRVSVQRLLEEVVFPAIPVSREEVLAAFHGTADRVRLSMLVRERREEAAAVLQELQRGASFIEAARASPDPVIRDTSGVLGWVARHDLAPELAAAAFSAPLLTPTGPVQVKKLFAVIIVHDRDLGDEHALRQGEPELVHAIRAAKRDGAVRRLLADLRARGRVQVNGRVFAQLASGAKLAPTTAVATGRDLRITVADLTGSAELASLRGVPPPASPAEASTYAQATSAMLDRRLLEAEAHRLKLDAGPVTDAAVRAFERRAAIERYLARMMLAAPPVREEEVQEHYAQMRVEPGQQRPPLEQVRAAIVEHVRRAHAEDALRARMAALRREADVVVDEAAVAQLMAGR